MPERAVFSNADILEAKGKTAPHDLAKGVAEAMNEMVEEGIDPATYEAPASAPAEEEQDPVLAKALKYGYDPDYEGEDAKTAEEFVEYGEKLDEEKARKATNAENRKLNDRLEKLENDRAVLAGNDAATLRQRMLDLTSLHKEAVEEADYQQSQAIQKQMDETKVQLHRVNNITTGPEAAPSHNPVSISSEAQSLIDDFDTKNAWINDGSETDTQIAQLVFQKYISENPGEEIAQVANGLKAIEKALPHRFKKGNSNRNDPAGSVRGGGRGKGKNQVTERDLSVEERNAFKAFQRAGTYKTVDEFHKDMVKGAE